MTDAQFVAKVRKSLGVSQDELAKRLGVSAAAVCRWEHGQRAVSRPVRTLLEQMVAKVRRK